MSEEKDEATLRLANRVEILSNCPLCCEYLDEQKNWCVHDPGSQYHELYCFLTVKGDSGLLRFYNAAERSPDDRMTHNIDDIECIKESTVFFCKVIYKDGSEYIHKAKLPAPYVDSTYLLTENYKDPTNLGTRYLMLQLAPDLQYRVWYDILKNIPMFDEKPLDENSPEVMDVLYMLESAPPQTVTKKGVQYEQRFKAKKSYVRDALLYLANNNPRNPFVEMIRRNEWDGTPRLDEFLYECGGRARQFSNELEKEYLGDVLKAVMLSALEKNLTVDYQEPMPVVLLLIGPQGAQKSTIARLLGLNKFHEQTDESVKDKKKYSESVQGGIIHEWLESSQLQGDTAEAVKAFIDRVVLNFRNSYARTSTPKQVYFVLVCTTNNAIPLSDESGNRRFMPVYVDKNDADVEPREHDMEYMLQLWAEALVLYNEGHRWADYVYDKKNPGVLKETFQIIQDTVTERSEEAKEVQSYLDTTYPSVGDIVESYILREYLRSGKRDAIGNVLEYGPMYTGKDLAKAMRVFHKSPEAFGFRRGKTRSIRNPFDEGRVTTSTDFVRVSKPRYSA